MRYGYTFPVSLQCFSPEYIPSIQKHMLCVDDVQHPTLPGETGLHPQTVMNTSTDILTLSILNVFWIAAWFIICNNHIVYLWFAIFLPNTCLYNTVIIRGQYQYMALWMPSNWTFCHCLGLPMSRNAITRKYLTSPVLFMIFTIVSSCKRWFLVLNAKYNYHWHICGGLWYAS